MGAEWGILYIRAEYPESIDIVQQAIDKLRANKLLGQNILGTGVNFDFKIIKAKGAYICGEETALINSIEMHDGAWQCPLTCIKSISWDCGKDG